MVLKNKSGLMIKLCISNGTRIDHAIHSACCALCIVHFNMQTAVLSLIVLWHVPDELDIIDPQNCVI